MCWGLSCFVKLRISTVQAKIDALQTAEDTLCTFSSLPGTAVVHEIKFKPGMKTSVLLDAWSIECRAQVTYANTTWHSGGVKEVDVFAGLEFKHPDDITSLCSSALGADWRNARVSNGNKVKESTFNGVPLKLSTEYRCGNFGWVGCRGTSSCKHHFSKFDGMGFDEMEKRGLNFLEPLQAEPENGGLLKTNEGECPALHDNAQLTCSIDASGQVRLGSSQDMLDKAMSDKEDAQAVVQTMMHFCQGCLLISFCLFALSLGLFVFFRSAFGRESGVEHLAQSLL